MGDEFSFASQKKVLQSNVGFGNNTIEVMKSILVKTTVFL